MMQTIVKWAIVVAICASVLFGVVHGYEMWRNSKVAEGDRAGAARVQALWDADVRKRDGEKLAAVAAAIKQGQVSAESAMKGERDARITAEKAGAKAKDDAAVAGRSAVGLLNHIAEIDGAARALGVPDAASYAVEFGKQRDAAVRARDLLGACSTEYRDLGRRVDDSWIAVNQKLDAAVGYIRAVKPAN